MDRQEKYKEIIRELILDYAKVKPAHGDIENEVVFDEKRQHYELLNIGWNGTKRIHFTVFHFDIKDGKVWLERNATDLDVGEELIEAGISREHIVLGLVLPQSRKLTKYGH
ncbi:XisI protein [bacterium]|nr:XisI protein [bacterium]